ncbi:MULTISPECIES: hypothetical protein [unclassified Nocardia]|uniref:hypothetical protein n=1 Tax=unclassified Nocardia TaxID=2637762 RepID=UPI00278C7548|nr:MULTISPECIES: hypothetical protein [unclassified Nocardia]
MFKITDAQVHAIQTAFDENGIDAKVDPNYTGRNMYDETCFGVVTSTKISVVAVRVAAVLAQAEYGDNASLEKIETTLMEMDEATDSMGTDTIVYWTNVKHVDVETE